MSGLLWKAYYEDDVDTFRQLLETAAANGRPHASRAAAAAGGGGGGTGVGAVSGTSPGFIGSPTNHHHHGSPTLTYSKARKGLLAPGTPGSTTASGLALTRGDANQRDAQGLTLLHHAASSTAASGIGFAAALIDHPWVDLYAQDRESGWTALHRAFYFGNITIARMILERDASGALGQTTGLVHSTLGLVKIKDKEGLGPLDLYAATIKDRTLRPDVVGRHRASSVASDDDRALGDNGDGDTGHHTLQIPYVDINGDQLFTFGSNKNVSLGFGDEDDRQFPERIRLRRPEHLIRRFFQEYVEQHDKKWAGYDPLHQSRAGTVSSIWVEDMPWMVRSKPIIIQDVHMSKLHTAVLTSDPESNLYMCGHGQGGRLGTGDERTRYHFVCIEGGALSGKRVASVALGQNHTLALSDEGEIFSWGNNGFGQLGYSLPKATSNDDDPVGTIPRQIYGSLKRETVIGIAASRIHSVVHTASSLFTFGKNEGQLGIVDSDARSLEMQVTPRKVAASLFTSSISAVTAIDKATICLLESHDVWVFANYGYAKIQFPLEGFSNYFLKQSFLATTYDHAPNRIKKITSGGDTICAMSSKGEVYTLSISQRLDNLASASTTNPAKIRSAITQPQRIWSPKKTNMAARDVDVDVDGSIILSTEEGSVWKRTRRAKINDASTAGLVEYKPKDYKFSRIPGLTRVLAVRSSGHGAYAAIRRDCDVLTSQIVVEDPTLWTDLWSLLSLRALLDGHAESDDEDSRHRFWQPPAKRDEIGLLRKRIIGAQDIEADLLELMDRIGSDSDTKYDAVLATTSSDVRIPVHRFVLAGRSRVLRRGFRDICSTSTFTIPDLAVSEMDSEGRVIVKFQGLDILTIVDLAMYLYTDHVVDFWHFVHDAPNMAFSYRQVRLELMKIATKLELARLEPAVRQMARPRPCLDMDFEVAFRDPALFHDGDLVIQLEDGQMKAHSALVCARCPFFEGLFMGRAGGRWLADRVGNDDVTVDLKHIKSKTFKLVLQHVYADTGPELFDEVVSADVDDFIDTVMDVMSAANELMLDRLTQIAQSIIGRFANTRNVCGLLNAISPSSVNEFKDAGLEYLCLNLEAMLQGHHLNELDEDLLMELDEVVRENQLASMPFAKSGRAEDSLHERHPGLAAAIDRNRQAKIDTITLRAKFADIETFMPGSYGEELSSSPMQQKARRRSSHAARLDVDRSSLKAKASSKDMMFEMDDEAGFVARSPRESPAIRPMRSPRGLEPIPQNTPPEDTWYDSRGKAVTSPRIAAQDATPGTATPRTPRSPQMAGRTPPHSGRPWTLAALPTAKSNLQDIMEQAASGRTSTLSQGLASALATMPEAPAPLSLPAPKMSQKDRKRLQHARQAEILSPPTTPAKDSQSSSPFAWRNVSAQKTASLKDVLEGEKNVVAARAITGRTTSTPQLTMRQTVANPKPSTAARPTIGPGTPNAVPQRGVSDNKTMSTPGAAGSKAQAASVSQSSHSRPIPQSIRHQPPIEQVWGLSMSDILAQQQAEKDIIKEAVAKRDLQEIQAEQEFQEWWEKESARVQEAERHGAPSATKASKKPKHRGGRSKRPGKSQDQVDAGSTSNRGKNNKKTPAH